MDNEKIDAILRKIKGLLAVAEDNANDEEAQSAFVRAQILMMKYNIDQREVENRLEEDASTIEDFGTVYKTLYWFERALAIVIAKNFRVKNFLYWKRHKGDSKVKRRVAFFGLEADVKIAKEVYILANEALLFYADRYVDHYYSITLESRNRANTLRIKNAYMLGFIEGLETKLEGQRNQLQQEYGLVVLMPVVVEERYKKIESGFTGNSNPFQLPNIDSINESLAYKRGLEDGETIDYTQSTIHDDIVI